MWHKRARPGALSGVFWPFFILNKNISSLTDAGAIIGLEVREDGVYITYVPAGGADAVTKKLGNQADIVVSGSFRCFHQSGFTAWGNGMTLNIPTGAKSISIAITYSNAQGLLSYKLDSGAYVYFTEDVQLSESDISGVSTIWVGLPTPPYSEQSQKRAEVTVTISF